MSRQHREKALLRPSRRSGQPCKGHLSALLLDQLLRSGLGSMPRQNSSSPRYILRKLQRDQVGHKSFHQCTQYMQLLTQVLYLHRTCLLGTLEASIAQTADSRSRQGRWSERQQLLKCRNHPE
jgi:hypothetical protein